MIKLLKTYKIPIIYQSIETFEVEAEDLQSAVYQALKIFLSTEDNTYIEDSFEIDSIVDDEYPDEKYDINVITNNL